jgi:DNA-binding NtrC family response regulator
MPTILLVEDDHADRSLIRQTLSDTEHTLLEAETLDDCREYITDHHIDLAMVSLTIIPEQAVSDFQRMLQQTPDTKILALAPIQGKDGLTTLLRAESLRAHHLLAKPINPQQLLAILQLTFPLPTQSSI